MARELTEYGGVMCWCDIEHVNSLTGVTVSEGDMTKAQGIITACTDVWPDELPDDLKAADLRRLQDALAYEAAWVKDKIGLFSEVLVSGVSQDGVSAQYIGQYAQFVAPLAMVCLRKLSWNRGGIQLTTPSGKYRDADAALDAFLRGEAEDNSGYGGTVPGRPFS
jgi:hypothetical protein